MKYFKGLIMSEYTSKLTILRHFLQVFSIPSKPIASAACDITLFLCKIELTLQIKIYTQTRVSCSISSKFSRGNIIAYAPKPQANNHRAALSLFCKQ